MANHSRALCLPNPLQDILQQVLHILLKTKLLVSDASDGETVVTLPPAAVIALFLKYKKYVVPPASALP